MKLYELHFSLGTFPEEKQYPITHFLDKPYQEINFKNFLNRVLHCKSGKILSDLHMSRVILFHFTCLCSLLK